MSKELDLKSPTRIPRHVRRYIRRQAYKGKTPRQRIQMYFRCYGYLYISRMSYLCWVALMALIIMPIHGNMVAKACDGYIPGTESDFCLNTRNWATFDGAATWLFSFVTALPASSLVMLFMFAIVGTSFKPWFMDHHLDDEVEYLWSFFKRWTTASSIIFMVMMMAYTFSL